MTVSGGIAGVRGNLVRASQFAIQIGTRLLKSPRRACINTCRLISDQMMTQTQYEAEAEQRQTETFQKVGEVCQPGGCGYSRRKWGKRNDCIAHGQWSKQGPCPLHRCTRASFDLSILSSLSSFLTNPAQPQHCLLHQQCLATLYTAPYCLDFTTHHTELTFL